MNIALNLLISLPVLVTIIIVGLTIIDVAIVTSVLFYLQAKFDKKVQKRVDEITEKIRLGLDKKTTVEDVAEQESAVVQPEPVEEVAEEVEPEPVEEIAEEVEPEPVEEIAEEVEPEPVEEIAEEVEPEPVEEVAEEVEPEPVEEVAEEVEPEPVEEVAEEVEPESVEEVEEEPIPVIVPVEEQTEEVEEESAEFQPEFLEPYEEDSIEDADDEEETTQEVVTQEPLIIPNRVAPEGKVFMRVRYNRSYTAKIIQATDTLKNYYTEIKNELMRYGVKSRISWRHETFRTGRKLLVRLAVRGKTLCVYLALDPANYADTKYKVNDVSAVAKNAEVPTLYKIKNDRRCKYVKDLIADVMAANGLTAGEEQSVDYGSQYPYEELEPLIDRKLVKLLPWKEVATDSEVGVIAVSIDDLPPELLMGEVSVTEAEDMFIGEDVDALVEESTKISDKTKKDIINIDTLGKYFQTGETVTVDEIRKRVPSINKKVTYIKVLARGRLDKALTVEADDFSPAAVKMIVLTGGKVIRTKAHIMK